MPKFTRLEIGVFVAGVIAIVTVNAWYRVKYAGRVQQQLSQDNAAHAEAGAAPDAASGADAASPSAPGAAPSAAPSASAPSPAAAPR